MHTLVFSDQHLNIIMELLNNAPYRVAAPVIAEIVKQIQANQPIQVPKAEEATVRGNGQ